MNFKKTETVAVNVEGAFPGKFLKNTQMKDNLREETIAQLHSMCFVGKGPIPRTYS